MRAIILALASSEREERNDTQNEKDKGEKRKSDVAQLLLFKPLLQYAIESVQKCSLVRECVV